MKVRYFFIGMISLIIFGLLLPQPIQAICVYTPLKSFFDRHTVVLCVLVGVIQGVSEECGYYYIMKKIYDKDQDDSLPFWFGMGRGVLHTIFDIVSVLLVMTSLRNSMVAIVSRLVCLGAMLWLTNLDYQAFKDRNRVLLVISVLFHFGMNSVIYANELDLVHFSESIFVLVYSCIVIVFGAMIMRLKMCLLKNRGN